MYVDVAGRAELLGERAELSAHLTRDLILGYPPEKQGSGEAPFAAKMASRRGLSRNTKAQKKFDLALRTTRATGLFTVNRTFGINGAERSKKKRQLGQAPQAWPSTDHVVIGGLNPVQNVYPAKPRHPELVA